LHEYPMHGILIKKWF